MTMINQPQPSGAPPAQSREHRSRHWLRAARVFWIILMAAALAILASSLPGYLSRIASSTINHAPDGSQATTVLFFPVASSLASLGSAGLSLFLSGVLFRRKFENPAIAAVSFYLLLYGIIMTGPLEAWGLYWFGSSDFAINIQSLLMTTPTIALLVLFPNGVFVPGWSRWVLAASIPWNLLVIFFPVYPYSSNNTWALAIQAVLWITFSILGFCSQVIRYRKVSTFDERQQTRWVLFGFGLWIGYLILSSIPYYYLSSLPPGSEIPWWAAISELGWWASLGIVPVTLTIAITRSRLWSIDIVINRTMVYGALTVATMVVYVLVVGTLGNLLHLGSSSFIAFLTTGLVAILFQPLREGLQGWVNRWMYGERDDPVAVLSRLGETLERTGSPADALESICETVARALKLPYAAIHLGDQEEAAASYGIPRPYNVRFPLVYQNETSGYLLAALRSPDEPFSTADLRLLENIARQAGAAAHAARLTTDLRFSRQKLVAAREEERRRIRRDLHDGLGPTLASMTLRMDALRNLLVNDPAKAEPLLEDIKKQAQGAIQDVRSLVYELRPPALDELGLAGAIQAHIEKQAGQQARIVLETDGQLHKLPAALEVAAYRIVMEGINNALRHAKASQIMVRLGVKKDILMVMVSDDGIGLQGEVIPGVGLRSMRERAEELGGSFHILKAEQGLRIEAHLPFVKE